MKAAHYREWIERAEIDYFTAFIKAWIPFNSWYRYKYTTEKSDREVINEIKKTSSIKSKIENWITGSDEISRTFKGHFASLHYSLEQNTINNDDIRLWFNEVVIETNPKNLVEESVNGYKYYIKRIDKSNKVDKIEVFVKNRTDTTIYSFTHTEYSLEELKTSKGSKNSDFNTCLTTKVQETLIEFYKEINPRKPTSLILKENPIKDAKGNTNYIEIEPYKFINDENLICKGVIEILYQLRNKLFHGEIEPTEGNQEVYKNAYFLLLSIIKVLK